MSPWMLDACRYETVMLRLVEPLHHSPRNSVQSWPLVISGRSFAPFLCDYVGFVWVLLFPLISQSHCNLSLMRRLLIRQCSKKKTGLESIRFRILVMECDWWDCSRSQQGSSGLNGLLLRCNEMELVKHKFAFALPTSPQWTCHKKHISPVVHLFGMVRKEQGGLDVHILSYLHFNLQIPDPTTPDLRQRLILVLDIML